MRRMSKGLTGLHGFGLHPASTRACSVWLLTSDRGQDRIAGKPGLVSPHPLQIEAILPEGVNVGV